jgi:hypothetical protein
MVKALQFTGTVLKMVCYSIEEEPPMKRQIFALLALAGAIASAAPAFAEYYIVREGPTGPCKIVAHRPADSKTIVGGNRSYASRAVAKRQLPLLCKSE